MAVWRGRTEFVTVRMFAPTAAGVDYEFVILLFGERTGWLPKVHPVEHDKPQPQRSHTMNAKFAIATAIVALAGAGSVFAAEGTQDFPAGGISSLPRAEVQAQVADALRSGDAYTNEASARPVANSTLSRVQVVAEAREALRLGLLDSSEVAKVATPAQAEQIRLAGERAVTTMTAKAR
jgi:hypothetical protein